MLTHVVDMDLLTVRKRPNRTESANSSYQAVIHSSSLMTNERRHMGFKEQYFDIWQQVWGLHKKYYDLQATDEERWKQLNDECEAIDSQYSGRPEQRFVQSLLLGVVAELERKASHEGKTEATTTIQP